MAEGKFTINVKTGDRLHAGTTSKVWIVLEDSSKNRTKKIQLGSSFRKGKEFPFVAMCSLKDVFEIELWRKNIIFEDSWHLEKVSITNETTGDTFEFPVDKWIQNKVHYIIGRFDTSLPQDDPQSKRKSRLAELKCKQSEYKIKQYFPGGPAQIAKKPRDEDFEIGYILKIGLDMAMLEGREKIIEYFDGPYWKSKEDLEKFYSEYVDLKEAVKNWKSDKHFGNQRICGVNPTVIQLCKQIPDKLNLTTEDCDILKHLMDGKTLQQAIDEKRLFIVDLAILEGTPVKEQNFVLPSPIAVFYYNDKKELMPIAIQLFQDGNHNPVFFPSDHPNTWLMAKMWYNLADASYHQSLTHLAFTHLIMEGFAITTHRQLSTSHPIFKLLAPHFFDLIAINSLALVSLISHGGWVDKATSIGVDGMEHLMAKGLKSWKLDTQGNLPADLETRGLYQSDVLEGYYFRDDALLLYNAIKDYVSEYVKLYYGNENKPKKLAKDWEIMNWGNELTLSKEKGGCWMKGIPRNGKFETTEDLIITLTSIIYTCSVAHASVNFPQFHEYGFPPNHPLYLNGTPPTNKDPISDEDILKAFPDRHVSLEIMTIVKVLSERATKSLGNFEKQYIYDPNAMQIVDKFRKKLKEISKSIEKKNETREVPYKWLDPAMIPNSISI